MRNGDWAMQKTINVDGDKIKIVAKPSTYMGNFKGFNVKVNEKKYFF
jgi:hypothetical protein